MTTLPEWTNWLARDRNGKLCAYSAKPLKTDGYWNLKKLGDNWIGVEETDDTFSHIEWTDEQPTEIKRGMESTGMSVAELNRIINAKTNEYDEPPIMSDYDMVTKPKHYIGVHGLEVEEVLQNFLPKITDGYVAHRVGSLIEYVLRHPEKNGCEDLEKAQRNLKQVFDYYNLKG